jgi:hypothetical protein
MESDKLNQDTTVTDLQTSEVDGKPKASVDSDDTNSGVDHPTPDTTIASPQQNANPKKLVSRTKEGAQFKKK